MRSGVRRVQIYPIYEHGREERGKREGEENKYPSTPGIQPAFQQFTLNTCTLHGALG